MDLDLVKWGLSYTKNRKKLVLALGALGMTGYGAYRVYNSPSVAKKREKLSKFFGALFCLAEMVSDSAEAIGVVSKDVKEFLESDSDQIPNSLKQISKIARSNEFSESLMKITRAMTLGILLGYRQDAAARSSSSIRKKKSDFSDRVLDKLFSETGSGFASVVVGSFARNLVMAYYTNSSSRIDDLALASSESVPSWVNLIFEEKSRELIGECVQLFVSTAVTVFLDKTMDINPYDELFSGMTNPKHEPQVREMLASLCNGAIETLVRTSHQALSNPSKDSKSQIRRRLMSNDSKSRTSFDGNQEVSGWKGDFASTMAIPRNRKFVLDVTGRVTFETVRSFLEYLLEKITECLKRSVDVIQEEVVDRGLEVVRYVSRRSSAVVTVCLSLCFHILNSPWILVPNY